MLHTNEERKEILVKEGSMYVIPEREKEWIEACNKAQTDLQIAMLEDVLKAVKLLDEGELSNKEIKEIVDDGRHSGFSWAILLGNVVKYSIKGYDFVEENEKVIAGSEFEKSIKKLYEDNISFPSQVEKFVFEKLEENKNNIIPERRKYAGAGIGP